MLVTLIVLGVILVAADRAAAWAAEKQLAKMAVTQAARYDLTAESTSVDIGGFGFLPQVVREDFSSVTLNMIKPTFSEVPAEDLQVTMKGVHVPRAVIQQQSGAAVTVETTDIRLQLAPPEIAKLAARATGLDGLTMRVVDGKLMAKLSLQGVSVDTEVTPTARNGRVSLAVGELAGNVPSVVREVLEARLKRGIALPKLPYDATLKEVAVEGSSVVLIASAANLSMTT
ncbi:hypothetical protein GCM10009534_50980 [Kribbella sandramycini]